VNYFGLTGGIASGKSTAARMFEELGAKTIDADQLGHELLRPPLPAYQEVVRRFGPNILDATGAIDRAGLGKVVFADSDKLEQLNAILHPRISERVEQRAEEYGASNPRAVILVDAALIFEAGIGGNFRKVIVAWCTPAQQIERLIAKTGLGHEGAARRIAAQMPVEEKRSRADFLIDCSVSLENTRKEVGEVFSKLKRIVDGKE
jgi:dephospho-CoA kinase